VIRRFLLIVFVALLAVGRTNAQAPQPDGGGVRVGVLPRAWQVSGPECGDHPQFQVHEYNPDFFILRESGCSNYEKPFVFLLFGSDRALLLDTGAGRTDLAEIVKGQVELWRTRNNRDRLPLIVAHTHAHGDHISGDQQLKALADTTVVDPNVAAVRTFFGIRDWPTEIATFDLGGRVLDIIPIPGHEASSIAVYDRQTGVLFTGDTLYPGRLYVKDASAFGLSVRRLVAFTQGKLVTHLLGNHIEQTRTPYLDYPIRTVYQPDEHALELGRSHLLELDAALQRMHGTVVRMAFRDFTVWPAE
jgi:hydroxyacylglutathione hydrolase